MPANHATHNEELANDLLAGKKYFDWVITTAFYSALHYTEFQLFPLKFGPTEYECFEDWYHAFKNNKDNKHDARKRLVYSNINPEAGAAYNWLKDECWSARYFNYSASENDAKQAINRLNTLKSYLPKLKTKEEDNVDR